MNVVIIKYNAGNIFSVDAALKRLNVNAVISEDKELIKAADKVIFPGVGEAATTMRYLRQRGMDKLIKDLEQPVLGICLGMQLMCRRSEEGNTDCLGIFDVDVKKFIPEKHGDKIPHMGWNTVADVKKPLFDAAADNQYLYFVHSYYVPVTESTAAVTHYIHPFSAALHTKNFYAAQFHPEKSGDAGEHILTNFLNL